MTDRFRFGEFEFDAGSGELRGQDGVEQRLPRQPARLLLLLAERHGDVVTRDEIRERLWPDTHVDFDTSLHFCVRQVRAALGDSASEPRYIQNVPRRGYRLIPQVMRLGDEPPPAVAAPAIVRRWRLAAIGVLTAAAISGTYYFAAREAADEPDLRIAIMPFEPPIGEWILQDLSDIAGGSVGIVGPTTTSAYSGADADLRRLASDYKVDYIVNGRSLGAKGGPRLLAELIRVSDGVHVWVQPYEDLADRRRVGQEISRHVARALDLH